MQELRMYSTVVGEIVTLVQKEIPKCFVEYEQYLELEKEYKKLLEERVETRDLKNLKLPPEYDNPADEEHKQVLEWYREALSRIQENSRGAILDMYGNTVWEEPLEEYEARMEALKND